MPNKSSTSSDSSGSKKSDAPTPTPVTTDNDTSTDKEPITRQVFRTKDGTLVEPSSIPAKEVFGPTPDPSKRPDVTEHSETVDENGNVTSSKSV